MEQTALGKSVREIFRRVLSGANKISAAHFFPQENAGSATVLVDEFDAV
jgi:hypothetical protein